MVDWLNEFAEKQSQKSKKMTKKASSNRIIVDKSKFAKATNEQIVSYKGAKYRVVDASYSDDKGKGVVLERCADVVGDPMEVAMGTAEDYAIGNDDFGEQEYARVDPEIQDPDPQAEEVAKFEEEAVATEEAIAQEDAIDGTSGATKPNRILMKLVEKYAPILTPVEEVSVEVEVPVEEEVIDEDVIDEESAEDDFIVDEFTEEDFNGLFDDPVEEEVEIDDEPEFIDDEEFDGEVEDDRDEEEVESSKKGRFARKMR